MKKIILAILVVFLAISCNNTPKEEVLYENLSSFYQKEDSKVLIGVKDVTTNEVILPAKELSKIDADDCIIRTFDNKGRVKVYNHQGTSIGGMSFDSFVRIKMSEDGFYYLGVNYDKKYFYYPQTKTFIAPLYFYQNSNTQCLITDETIYFYDHSGNCISKYDTSQTVYLLETKDKTVGNFYIVITVENNVKKILDTSLKEVKTLTTKEWAKLEKTLSNSQRLTNFNYATIDKI
jgi:hypothetical protein